MTFDRHRCAVVCLAAACTRDEPAPPPVADAPTEVAPTPSPSKAVEEKPEPPPPDDEPAPARPRVVALDAVPVIRSRSALQLFESDDGTPFVVANAHVVRLPAEGPIVQEPALLTGIAAPEVAAVVSWRATTLGGRWPDSLHMVVEAEGGARWQTPQIYRFATTGWTRIDNLAPPLAWSYVGFSPWRDGDTLTLRTWAPLVAPAEDGGAAAFGELRDMLRAKAPRAFESLRDASTGTPQLHGHEIAAFDSLPTGDVIAISGAETLHWSPGATEPRRVALAVPSRSAKLEMFGPADAYLLDDRGLLHFDGTAWARVSVPADAGVDALALSDDGTLWMVAAAIPGGDPKLLERRANGAWRDRALPDVAFPADAQPRPNWWAVHNRDGTEYVGASIERERAADELAMVPVDVVVAGDALWITARERAADTDDHWVLLHDVARGPVIELPDLETMRREALDAAPEVPFDGQEGCEVFVPIDGKAKGLRGKLAGVELPESATMLLLEVVRDGKPAVGVVLPNDATTNLELVASLQKALGKKMRPAICQDMVPRRQLARFP